MPTARALSISSSVLPTPEYTNLAGSPPARRARNSSPPEVTSMPAPRAVSSRTTARFMFALIA
jgi:hypothetical protein